MTKLCVYDKIVPALITVLIKFSRHKKKYAARETVSFKNEMSRCGGWGRAAPCSQIHSPWMGFIVDSLQHCVVVPACQPGRYDNPMHESTLSPPVRDYEFGYWRACAGWQIHQAPRLIWSGLRVWVIIQGGSYWGPAVTRSMRNRWHHIPLFHLTALL
jgi:hypothetical protein